MRFHNKIPMVDPLEEVAIIGVLVAISIPIFTSQLEKAREAVDLANIRAGYAEVMTSALTDDKSNTTAGNDKVVYDATNTKWTYTVSLKQKKDDWQTAISDVSIGTVKLSDVTNKPKEGKTATITYTAGTATTEGTVTIDFAQN